MVKRQPGPIDYALLVSLSLMWGASFLWSKIAVAELAPLTVTLFRQTIAAVLLLGAALATRRWFVPTARDHVYLAICAMAGTVIPFTLINWGVEVIDSGLAAILMGLMPLTVMLLAHLTTADEKLTLPKLAGVLLGLAGLAILFWPQLRAGFGHDLVRQVAVLGAAVAYAVNALSTKRLIGHPPMALIAYISLWTLAILTPAALVFDGMPAVRPSGGVIASLACLGLVSSVGGSLVMVAIIRRQGASFFGQANLLIPIAGLLLGVVFLGERPGLNALAAMAIIFCGLMVARIKTTSTTSIAQESLP